MDQVLDFITENYIGFAIGGGVLVLAIIGFIGEKVRKGNKEEVAPIAPTPEPTPQAQPEELFGEKAATESTEFNLYGSPSEQTPVAPVEPTSAAETFEYSGFEPQSLEATNTNLQPNVMATPETVAPVTPEVETLTETPAPVVAETPAPAVAETPAEPVVDIPVAPVIEVPSIPAEGTEPTPVATDTENRF